MWRGIGQVLRYSKWILAVLLVHGVCSTSCTYSTAPGMIPDIIQEYWDEAQVSMVEDYCYPHHEVYALTPYSWEWIQEHHTCEWCQEHSTYFGLTRVNSKTSKRQIILCCDRAAVHEARHAILWDIDRPNWERVDHDKTFKGLCY